VENGHGLCASVALHFVHAVFVVTNLLPILLDGVRSEVEESVLLVVGSESHDCFPQSNHSWTGKDALIWSFGPFVKSKYFLTFFPKRPNVINDLSAVTLRDAEVRLEQMEWNFLQIEWKFCVWFSSALFGSEVCQAVPDTGDVGVVCVGPNVMELNIAPRCLAMSQ
jgi:hypothetical protein